MDLLLSATAPKDILSHILIYLETGMKCLPVAEARQRQLAIGEVMNAAHRLTADAAKAEARKPVEVPSRPRLYQSQGEVLPAPAIKGIGLKCLHGLSPRVCGACRRGPEHLSGKPKPQPKQAHTPVNPPSELVDADLDFSMFTPEEVSLHKGRAALEALGILLCHWCDKQIDENEATHGTIPGESWRDEIVAHDPLRLQRKPVKWQRKVVACPECALKLALEGKTKFPETEG
jgi:hypothetical protein